METPLLSAGDDSGKVIVVQGLLGRSLLEFSGHALEQMKIRRLKDEWVLKAIEFPDEVGLPTQDGRDRVRLFRSETKAIDVVYELAHDRIIVITAFPTKRSRT